MSGRARYTQPLIDDTGRVGQVGMVQRAHKLAANGGLVYLAKCGAASPSADASVTRRHPAS